ncbi:MAG: protein tyrosine kinase, partial [Anaerolineae bacterium]|nr:protein tyrosine kinase [Anaerolineae bacterium]
MDADAELDLRQYFAIIWRWLWLILLSTILAGGTAFLVSRHMAPVYQASTTLLISQARNPGVTDYTSILTSERLARTYANLLTKRPVLEEVSRRLGIQTEDGTLPATINVQPIRDTQLIKVNVESTDPRLAMEVANTLPTVFIEQNAKMQLSRFANSKENLSRQMASLEKDIERTQQSIAALQGSNSAEDQARLAQLQNALTQYQTSYANLLKSYEEIRLAEAQSMDNVVVAEPAELPRTPVRPRVMLNTLLAAIVGGMIALGAVFFIEYLDDTVKTPDEVSQLAGLPTLGTVIRFRSSDGKDRLVTAQNGRSPVSEAYRTLRTNLQFSTVDAPLRTLLVTSSNPLEGKSTTVANLAVVMAQAGFSTIIVDTDLRRPILDKIFGVPRNVGVANALLTSELDISNYLYDTGVENLRILTCGPK